jgi:hypothetical protein
MGRCKMITRYLKFLGTNTLDNAESFNDLRKYLNLRLFIITRITLNLKENTFTVEECELRDFSTEYSCKAISSNVMSIIENQEFFREIVESFRILAHRKAEEIIHTKEEEVKEKIRLKIIMEYTE